MMALALATESAPQAPTLEQLAEDIRREHELCIFHALSALEHAVRTGEALLKARESMLGINRKCVDRWVQGDTASHESNHRKGRPTRAEQKERKRLVAAEQRRAIGPAALATCFRSVWEAHRQRDQAVLISALHDLANTAVDWAEQLEARRGDRAA
jgi:hypothetical protein